MIRALLTLLALAAIAAAQPPREEAPPALPEALPPGVDVSRPLHPSDPLPPVVIEPPGSAPPAATEHKSASTHWGSLEYVLAWTPAANLPPLATANLFGTPLLGDPNTVTVLGGRRVSRGEFEGMRVVLGRGWDDGSKWGREFGYSFLGSKTNTDTVTGGGVPGEAVIGRPLVNARTGAEDAVLVSHANMLGQFDVSQSLRVQGWEATLFRELAAGDHYRLSGLGGYRYFMANDGLRLEQLSEYLTADGRARSSTADQIDAHSRFHGGSFGLRSQFDYAGFFAQADTKVAFGGVTEVVRISGQTVATLDTPGGSAVSYFNGGVFGQPSNTGRAVRQRFAVLPEANVRVGYAVTDGVRLFVGYQFTYLSEAVRAADQLDRTVDLGQGTGGLGLRPRPTFDRSDFWVQAITFGLEWRY